MSRAYFIYILASRSRNLYTGVTGNLERRLVEHRKGLIPGFTTRYRIFRLVHCEAFGDIRDAIAREKEIKAWRREKKIRLIDRHNPAWEDLAGRFPGRQQAAKYGGKARPRDRVQQKQIPHARSPRTGDGVRDDTMRSRD